MSKSRVKHAALRLPADGTRAVVQLTNGTGWPFNKSLSFIVQAGWNALNGGSSQIPAMRQVMTIAIAHHETELSTRKWLAASAKKLRSARTALAKTMGGVQ